MSLATFAQVGIGTETPQAALDVVSTDSGLVVPRVADTDAVASPVNGMVVYDIANSCLKAYQGDAWSDCLGIASDPTVNNDCDADGFVYTAPPRRGVALSGASFSVTVSNNSYATATLAFETGDLVLSGDSSGDIIVSTPSPTSATLLPGEIQKITYPLTGTPTTAGTLSADWSKLNLSCTKTLDILNGDATFTIPTLQPIISVNDGGSDLQGVIDNATHQFTIDIPYTAGSGIYDAYTSTAVSATGESDTNGITITYPAGNFAATGLIRVTVVVDGDGTFNVKKQLIAALETIGTFDFQVNGVAKGNLVLESLGAILDHNFADADHKFVYLPVTNPTTGRTWLNNNLGAHYSNMNHAAFDPDAQATAYNDFNAYGSYIQWGRYTDGHELINFTGPTTATALEGATSTASASPSPATKEFITGSNWYTGTSPNVDDLWEADGSGVNEVCPTGYRLPTLAEEHNERISWTANNHVGAFNSPLKFSLSGYRATNGVLSGVGSHTALWSSQSSNGIITYIYVDNPIGVTQYAVHNPFGLTVRCIKD